MFLTIYGVEKLQCDRSTWLKKEYTEGRGNEIPRDPEEISRLNKFRKRVKEIKVNIHLSEKKVIAGYEAGKHFKAEDEWTTKCEVCKNLFTTEK